MKFTKQLLATVAVLAWSVASHAATQWSQTVTVNQFIPDGSPVGLASTINVSLPGADPATAVLPGSLSVRLNISGGYNGDLYACVTHGNQYAVLLNRPGVSAADSLGYGDSGMNVLFTDQASNWNVHNYQQVTTPLFETQLTGTWGVDGRTVSPYSVDGTEAPTATLSSFNWVDPNGNWTLFVADVNGGDISTLVSWGVEFSAVPEPAVFSLLAAGGLLGFALLRRRLVL